MSKIETAETLNELADAIKELHESQKTKKGSLDEIAEFCRNLTSFTAMESLPKKHGIYEKAKEILKELKK